MKLIGLLQTANVFIEIGHQQQLIAIKLDVVAPNAILIEFIL